MNGAAATARSDGARNVEAAAGMLSRAPVVILALMAAPVAAGLIGAAAPAFGYLPALGGETFSLAPWAEFVSQPGVFRSILISFSVGILAAAAALAATLLFLAAGGEHGPRGTRIGRALFALVSPLLSIPHAAAALGVAFLIAPSGWLFRLLSPWATGWTRPPDWLIVNDPYALSMIFGLVIKEIPFLLLLALAALPQIDAARSVRAARSLGYGATTAWLKVVAPQLYPLLRLPVYAVIAYGASTVEIALILGPSQPAALSARVLTWLNDPDLDMRFMASAAALTQLAVVIAAIGAWRLGEIAVWRAARIWACDGRRRSGDGALRALGLGGVALAAAGLLAGLAGLAVASIAGFWRFPAALPGTFTPRRWLEAADGLWSRFETTALIAVVSAGAALLLAVLLLESERRSRPLGRVGLAVLYLPLLAPQVSFLFGLTIGAASLGLNPGFWPVAAAHLLFTLPYVYLSLAGAYQRFDPRWDKAARALGASPSAVFWRVRAPMLLGPGLTALAVGLAVSIAQYLPTLLLGGGRVATVTTEAVALSAGGDRGVIGVWALAQAVLPMLGFWMASAVPRLVWARRAGMRFER